jgi:hypothetical protein
MQTDTSTLEVNIEALSHQVEFWTNEENDVRLAMVGPYGCGKTRGLAIKQMLLRQLNSKCDGMLVVPTYDMFKMIHREEWPSIWADMGIVVEWNESTKSWTWPWGNRTWVRTAEKPDRLAGANLSDVMYDEPGQMVREAWDRGSVRARHPLAAARQVILAGTPEGINWFADLFSDPSPPYYTIWAREWHPSMAHYPAQIEETYGYDESLLESYMGGKFVPVGGRRAYPKYDPATHSKIPVLYDEDLPIHLACDFNVDYLRWLVCQVTPKEVRVLDEIALPQGGNTPEGTRIFRKRWGHHRNRLIVTGDSSGNARSTSSTMTDYQIIREELSDKTRFLSFNLSIPSKNPFVRERVANVNYHLGGRGRRIFIDPKCKHLKKDFERVQRREGSDELDKTSDPKLTHASDAFGYLLWQVARSTGSIRSRGGRVDVSHAAAGGY